MKSESHMNLKVHAFAHAAGLLSLISIVFYALFIWFGSSDGSDLAANFPITFGFNDWTFLFGLIQAYVVWYIAAWIFAKIYNNQRR